MPGWSLPKEDSLLRRLLLAVLVLVALAPPASAHTVLQSVTPADGATVTGAAQVQLVFSGEVREELSAVAVTGPGGTDVVDGPPSGSGTRVVQPLRAPLPDGTWTVAYRVVAADGHPVTGTTTFVVQAQAAAGSEAAPEAGGAAPGTAAPAPPADEVGSEPAAAPAPAPAPPSEASGGTPVLLLVLVAAALVGAVLLAVRLRAPRAPDGRRTSGLPST